MPFDMGFNFRGTVGYVTDQAYAVPVLGEAYPHTYTNTNGDSINAGWQIARNTYNALNTNDPRIAGMNYQSNNNLGQDFQINLSSGSAPGAGAYTIDLAVGRGDFSQLVVFHVLDSTTLLIDGDNGSAGFSTAANHFIDATLTDVAGGATWTGSTVSKTFATTSAIFRMSPNDPGGSTGFAHFRLAGGAGGGGGGKPMPYYAAQMGA